MRPQSSGRGFTRGRTPRAKAATSWCVRLLGLVIAEPDRCFGTVTYALPPGWHRLVVRARDADLNLDPAPAVREFMVLPPVWNQVWFIALIGLLVGLIVAQSVRVRREQRRLREARDVLEVRVRRLTADLESANRGLEAFSRSVSHDLRAPLRSIDGFSRILVQDCAGKLSDDELENLQRIHTAAQRMGRMIDDMLRLARVTRTELRTSSVDLSRMAHEIVRDLAEREPGRKCVVRIAPNAVVHGDRNLLRIALENLLGNAWKFSARRGETEIEFGITTQAGEQVFFVRDNGAGFDMAFAAKLFRPFQRLHSHAEFPGSGVGLAIVQRVIERHGGRVWAESTEGRETTFSFTIATQPSP